MLARETCSIFLGYIRTWTLTTLPVTETFAYPRVTQGRLLVGPRDAPLPSDEDVLALLQALLRDVNITFLGTQHLGLGPRLVALAHTAIAIRSSLSSAAQIQPDAACLLPLASAGIALRTALAQAMAVEFIVNIEDETTCPATMGLRSARSARLQAVAHERLANGSRLATITMALHARGSSVDDMVLAAFAAAGALPISTANIAFYAARRGPAQTDILSPDDNTWPCCAPYARACRRRNGHGGRASQPKTPSPAPIPPRMLCSK
jgi:hypothetical protein